MARHIFKLVILLLLVFPGSALSAEDTGGPGASPSGNWYGDDFLPAQHLTLEPDIFMYMGYRFTGHTGAIRAAQYDYLHSSPAGGLSLHYYPLPFMVDADFDYKNEYDHNAEVALRFTDMIKLDYRHMAMFHNMDHQRLIMPTAVDKDPDRGFGVKVQDNEVKLVIKSPGRPYHLYVDLREFNKNGTIQQRFASNLFGPASTSVPRDIDWITRELTAGINGDVLGLFELDYHHTIKTFDSNLRSVLGPDPMLVGTYLHNRISDLESNTDTISIHSNQSWPVAAAGTFSWGDKVNKSSGARVDFHREYGDVTYRPLDNLYIAVKYGHQQLNATNPTRTVDVNFATATTTVIPVSNGSLSTVRDRGTLSVMYYPIPKLAVLAEYRLDSVEKDRDKEWSQVDQLNVTKNSSITHTGKVSLTATPLAHTRLRAGFSYSHTGDPERNVNYEQAYEGFVSGNWVPMPGLNVNAQYNILRGDNPVRNDITSAEPVKARNRHVEKDSASAGVSWFAHKGLVLGAHYDYLRFKVETNIIYELNGVPTDMYTFDSPYNDSSHSYTVFANYCFEFPLKLEGTFSQIWTTGNYRLDDFLTAAGLPQAGAPASGPLANLTDQKTRETRGTVKAQYDIWKGWGTAICYSISQFSDLANVDRPVAGMRNGTAHSGSVMLTKKW